MQKIIQTTHGGQCLNEILRTEGITKVLLVCDGAFASLPTRDEYLAMEVRYGIFSDFTSNPLYEDVVKGVRFFREGGFDGIVAIGGGSSIDVAKCIKLYSGMDDAKLYLDQEYIENPVPIIAVPTTAGTGSESTRFAVIYYDGKKQSVTHDAILPQYAILDHRNLDSLPLYQKKCTMADALCQSIESWWSVNATEESRGYSARALELVMENMRSYLRGDIQAGAGMQMGANLAGRAINIAQTTAAHAMSYKLTSLYGVPHGRAAFMCLTHIWKYMQEKGVLPEVFSQIARTLGFARVEEAIEYLFDLDEELFGEDPVAMDEKDLELLTISVNPTRLKNNPLPLSEEEISRLYRNIMGKWSR